MIVREIMRGAEMASRAQYRSGQARQAEAAPVPKPALTAAEKAAQERAERRQRPAYMPLDEIARWVARHVVATPAMIDAMVLLAAQTWVCDTQTLVTTPRALWVGVLPESGKTNAMMVTGSLCYCPEDADGTWDSVMSGMAAYSTEGKACPTLYFDEIQTIFGPGGTRGQGHPLGKVLKKGYKRSGKMARSVDRSKAEFSIFSTFLMSGLATAVLRDIRSRCIVFRMEPGVPKSYFDARDAEAQAEGYAKVLGAWVKSYRAEIRAFRGRKLGIVKLVSRRLEIWEPLFAVAACAGQEWLDRCYTAFCELGLDESDQPMLTPVQTIVRDLAAVADVTDGEFIGGLELADELTRMDDPLYAGHSALGVARLIAEALPFGSQQVSRLRGYFRADLLELWEQMRPAEAAGITITEDDDPYACTDDDEDDTDAAPFFAGHTDARIDLPEMADA